MVFTSVSVDSHGSVSDHVFDLGSVRTVDRDLLVVGSQSVSVGVRVREESPLQHLVDRWLHSWDQMSGRESRLLSLSEIVVRVPVQHQSTDWDQRVV